MANEFPASVNSPSLEPIVQRSIAPFPKVVFKAAVAAQPGKITSTET
jgi:hypothetical protein